MAKLIPPRPRYQKERIWVGYPALAIFALLFVMHLLDSLTKLPFAAVWLKLLGLPAVFLIPIVVFCLIRGYGYSRVLRIRAPRASHIPLLISAFFALLCGALLLSILCGGMDSLGNSVTAYETELASSPVIAIGTVLGLAVIPAVLEELFFRGIVAAEYERRGGVRAVIMSTLLFALCHFDLHNLPVYLFSGVLFMLVLLATDSLVATMLLHACYNLVSLLGQRYLNAFYDITGSIELFLFALILILLISLVLFFRFAAGLYRERAESGLLTPRRAVPYNVQFYTTLDALCDPPLLLTVALSVVGIILF